MYFVYILDPSPFYGNKARFCEGGVRFLNNPPGRFNMESEGRAMLGVSIFLVNNVCVILTIFRL